MMLVAKMLHQFNDLERNLYLYDTFSGMPEPSDYDKKIGHEGLIGTYGKCIADIDDVKNNLKLTKYPISKIDFVEGKVEDTVQVDSHRDIALLRLDTDWYESTKHELQCLFPKVVKGGIIIFDDYGVWQGCKKAVDEYFEENGTLTFLHRIDVAGRIMINKTFTMLFY